MQSFNNDQWIRYLSGQELSEHSIPLEQHSICFLHISEYAFPHWETRFIFCNCAIRSVCIVLVFFCDGSATSKRLAPFNFFENTSDPRRPCIPPELFSSGHPCGGVILEDTNDPCWTSIPPEIFAVGDPCICIGDIISPGVPGCGNIVPIDWP